MTTETLNANKFMFVEIGQVAGTYAPGSLGAGKYLIVNFPETNVDNRNLKINSITPSIYIDAAYESPFLVNFEAQLELYDADRAPLDNVPEHALATSASGTSAGWLSGAAVLPSLGVSAAENGMFITSNQNITAYGSSPYPARLAIEYASEIVGLRPSSLSPASGSIVATNPNTFSWATEATGVCFNEISATGAVFRWRTSASESVHEVSISANASSVTIPANTFSGSQIQWQVSVTANSGQTSTSEWVTLSLSDATSTAVAVSPAGLVLDGSIANVFQWNHIISSGTAQTKAELQQSTDGSTWTALAMVLGSATSWTAPAGTFTSGQKYWRVRTYNSVGTEGAWSEAVQFIVVAAPTAPVVAVTSTQPRPVIRWQSEEQQAYQVEIEGVYSSGTLFGTGKTWQSPRYLADGNYTARVRVQNEYGLWSAWGTAALPVANTPGGTIVLSVTGGIEASLVWSASGFDFYLVYRDGVSIAKVTEPYYTDTASIGAVRYQVRGCYADSSNYSLSEEVSAEITVDRVRICDMEGGGWLEALYESSAHRSTALALGRDIQYVNLSGRAYPVAERSEFLSRSLTVTCCCADQAQRQAVRAILGRLVCVKTPEGNMVIGYPGSISENSDGFFSTYSFTVQQIDRKEEIDLDA